eukprot:COSAG03_NODE_15232_length_437_cov_1.109467_1_plen_88_part_01
MAVCECGVITFCNIIIGVCISSLLIELGSVFVDADLQLITVGLQLVFFIAVPLFIHRFRARLGPAGRRLKIVWALIAVPQLVLFVFAQ